MDKYQKAAALDLLKVAGIGVVVSVLVNVAIINFTAQQIIGALAVILLVYTGYNLFKIRVDQHRTLDELRNDRK